VTEPRAAEDKIRILIVAPSLRFVGGQAVQARRLTDRLSEESWADVSLLVVDPTLPGPLRQLQRIKYVRTVMTSIAYVYSLLRTIPRFDVVHAFSPSYTGFLLAPVPAMLVGRLFRKRVLINYRSGEAADHLSRWGWHAIPLLRLAHAIVVPSGYLVDVFSKFGLSARSVLNFLDIDALVYRERTALRPLFLSNRNFEAHYNVADVIRAFAEIQREVPTAEMDVLGDGPLRSELHALVAELGVRNVRFAGAVSSAESAKYYDRADIYLNAPTIDNMPNSVIEAFASGIPVVTSDAGGIPYIVRHEENGLLVGMRDPHALAQSAMRLLHDQALVTRLTTCARQEALTRYLWTAVCDQWRAVYTQSLSALGAST
jgi:glycosyltransferase involved in cell wall biosynthesis